MDNANDDIFNKNPNPAPAAPETPVAPAAQPAPEAPQPTPVAPVTPASEPVQQAPKKSKKGLIIGLSAAAVAVIGGSVGAFAIYRTQPDVVISEAVANVLTARNLGISGTVSTAFNKTYAKTYGMESVTLTFDGAAGPLPASASAKLEVKSDNYSNLSLKFSNVIMEDGVVYLQVDGVEDAIDAYFEAYLNTIVESQTENCSRGTSYYSNCNTSTATLKNTYKKEYEQYKSYFSDTLELVDGTWWRISVDELIDAMDDELGLDIEENYSDAYKCLLSEINNPNTTKELSSIYQQNKFVNVSAYDGNEISAKSGGNLYSISFNSAKVVDFAKNALSSASFDRAQSCLTKIDGFKKVNPSEIKDSTWNHLSENIDESYNKNLKFYVEANNWSHQLSRLYMTNTGDSTEIGTATADLNFTYNAPTAQAPTSSKEITKLIQTVANDFSKMYASAYENYLY